MVPEAADAVDFRDAVAEEAADAVVPEAVVAGGDPGRVVAAKSPSLNQRRWISRASRV